MCSSSCNGKAFYVGPQLCFSSSPTVDFYSSVRQKWISQANRLRNVTVVSVGGGYRDYQVRSGLTSLPCPPGDPNKLSLVVGKRFTNYWGTFSIIVAKKGIIFVNTF